MNRRAHYLLRAAAVAVLVVEALLPVRGASNASKAPNQANGEANGDVKVQPAPAATPAPAAPVAMN
jgi:hypothetical protein